MLGLKQKAIEDLKAIVAEVRYDATAIKEQLVAAEKELEDYIKWLKGYKFPPLPWTIHKLGPDVYHKTAVDLGYGDYRGEGNNFKPDLDPTPFLPYMTEAAKKGKPEPSGNKPQE